MKKPAGLTETTMTGTVYGILHVTPKYRHEPWYHDGRSALVPVGLVRGTSTPRFSGTCQGLHVLAIYMYLLVHTEYCTYTLSSQERKTNCNFKQTA